MNEIERRLRFLYRPLPLFVTSLVVFLVSGALFTISILEIVAASMTSTETAWWAEPMNDVSVALFVVSMIGCAGLLAHLALYVRGRVREIEARSFT